MSLLTPLYIAGLLAVSLPLVFHLIRRMPRGRQSFSTLMFLSPSLPRITRRSRLDNLLLLALRALALVLLALAFARPFLRETAELDIGGSVRRRVALLVDTSASMRRGNLWQQAVAKVDEVLDGLRLGDDVALFTFDSEVHTIVRFSDVTPGDPKQQISQVREQLGGLAPTWALSELGEALVAVADEINDVGDTKAEETTREIVLIGDLQRGSRLEALQAYEWPEDVQVTVSTVALVEATNAGLHLAGDVSGHADQQGNESVRVRVTNDPDSVVDEFALHWTDRQGTVSGADATSVYVPAGESRIVQVPRGVEQPATDQLRLTGDDHPFDNSLYLVPVHQEEALLVYLGSDSADDRTGLCYYFQRAFPETPRRRVRVVTPPPEEPLAAEDLLATRLVVVAKTPTDRQLSQLQEYLADGGAVFYVLKEAAAGTMLGRLMQRDALVVEEAPTDDYAMLGDIEFAHPIFAPFSDPRFNDFTKIHFWHHRRVDLEDVPNVQVLARFDDGDPALFEVAREKGRLLVLSTGWHPSDSTLGRSTKFVGLMWGVLARSGLADAVDPQYRVDDRVMLAAADSATQIGVVRKPDGTEVKLTSGSTVFDETDQPGVYNFSIDDAPRQFAVNVASEESRTAPLELDELEQRGVRLGRTASGAEIAKRQRQMRDVELESRQKLWRWLILAGLGVLILETTLAGYLAHQSSNTTRVTA